jgi:hypothetical protein
MMGQILSNGELQLTDEECEKLSLPPNSVVPVENVEEFQAKLQSMYDDDVRKLARQIGTKPTEEPYPGYYADIERLGLDDKTLVSGSANPAGLYGPDGKAYAPWMIGKIAENVERKPRAAKSKEDASFEFSSRGQELSGVGLVARLLGDEVKLSWTVGKEENSRGYIVTKRPGGADDSAFQLVADYQTPGASLAPGSIDGSYSYVDGDVSPGVWVYRVQEEDISGVRTGLSQTIVDVPSNSDKVKTLVAGFSIVTILGIFAAFALNADPQNGL